MKSPITYDSIKRCLMEPTVMVIDVERHEIVGGRHELIKEQVSQHLHILTRRLSRVHWTRL